MMYFSVKNAQSCLGQKAFPVRQGVHLAGFINGISFKTQKEPFGIPKGSFTYFDKLGYRKANLCSAGAAAFYFHSGDFLFDLLDFKIHIVGLKFGRKL